jgi:DNA polymerase III epsilon subunit family exonuclease
MARKMSRTRIKPPEQTYAVLDLETTGLDAQQDSVIEIGAIKAAKGEISAQYHTLVIPKQPISQSITELTGITKDVLQTDGKPITEAIEGLLSFIGPLPIVSHNASFDYAFLQMACRQCGQPPVPNPCIDTLAIARRVIKNADNYKLATLAAYLGIAVKHVHRSIADCMTTMRVYEKLIEMRDAGK